MGTPPSLTTDADGVRRQGTGPFISIRVLRATSRNGHAEPLSQELPGGRRPDAAATAGDERYRSVGHTPHGRG
jgi:hypothetical protein